MEGVGDFRWVVKISLHRNTYKASDAKVMYYKKGLSFELFNRWKWFFRYRAAMIQVQHLKQFVELEFIKVKFTPDLQVLLKRAKDKFIGAKATLTKYTNKKKEMEDDWNELFPIEQHPKFMFVMDKIDEYEIKRKVAGRHYAALLKKSMMNKSFSNIKIKQS